MLSPNFLFKNTKLPNQQPETMLFKVAILLPKSNRKKWAELSDVNTKSTDS